MIYNKQIFLVRHGETAWTIQKKHTGLTDIDLTEKGRQQAEQLRQRLQGTKFEKVLVSPLKRAKETCEIAGFLDHAEVSADLLEWNYGEYEGKTTEEIHRSNPDWTIFTHGAPGGESLQDIEKRSERILKKIDRIAGNVVLFSSGHFLRALAAKWLNLSVQQGRLFVLGTASISILGFERAQNAIILWNDTGDFS